MQRKTLSALRKRKRQQRWRWVVLCVFATLVAAAGAGALYLVKEWVRTKEVAVLGNRHLKADEVRSLMKFKEGDPLFGASVTELYRRLRKSPWVRDAIVRKDPSGKVTVRLQEATAAAILHLDQKQYLVDGSGSLLEEMKEGSMLFLPVIREIDPVKQRDTYREALNLVRFLQQKGAATYGGVLEISGARPEEITLRIDDIPVRIGMGEFEKKLERLQLVKDEIKRRNVIVEYIDVRFSDEIVIKQVRVEPSPPAKPAVSKKDGREKQKKGKLH
jgi:cell division protein FtsQ